MPTRAYWPFDFFPAGYLPVGYLPGVVATASGTAVAMQSAFKVIGKLIATHELALISNETGEQVDLAGPPLGNPEFVLYKRAATRLMDQAARGSAEEYEVYTEAIAPVLSDIQATNQRLQRLANAAVYAVKRTISEMIVPALGGDVSRPFYEQVEHVIGQFQTRSWTLEVAASGGFANFFEDYMQRKGGMAATFPTSSGTATFTDDWITFTVA